MMKFPDIDFDAIGRMVDLLDDNQKEKITSMASDLMNHTMNNLNPEDADQNPEDQSLDYTEYFNISDDLVSKLDSDALSALEAASDLAQFYDEIPEADLSASVLFLSKAALITLRNKAGKILKNNQIDGFNSPQFMSLGEFLTQISNLDNKKLNKLLCLTEGQLKKIQNELMQIELLLSRSQFDTIRKEDLDYAKSILIDDQLLLDLANIKFVAESADFIL
ncbi:hypothetical protein [Ileibacterium valens]|uniref:Uncharacterized protein n=1 Tax=Ileibacterium valens TaxID=1862668 RepID=A0A1U7NEW4_9FIRM|nr:hypothetical protein [Ileibacterium valens]OLU37701.1 hypothetical protein BM735_10245 [Erysipelotrichaceae bacterium NYU-BL-F16]OLU38315.1 hypothetical protein BO222_08625 [Ileibacterium valens]OLU38377.1 hypothetical protein BO224_09130 [Erysipelotrichaceae bacterium NYU-BL-E8]